MGIPLNPGKTVESLGHVQTEALPEVFTVAFAPDVAGSKNNKYFTFGGYYAWANINGAGSDPAPGGTGIEYAGATGATAVALATAAAAAINATGVFTASREGSTLQIAPVTPGTMTDVNAGNSGFTVATVQQGQAETYSPGINPASISLNPSA